MPWETRLKLPYRGSIYWTAYDRERLFLRDADGISCYDLAQRGTQRWVQDFPNDHSFGYKPLVLTHHAVITASHPDHDPKRMVLSAWDRETGQPLWERPVAWSLNHTLGGMLGDTHRLALIENASAPQFVVLDAQTGGELLRQPGLKVLGEPTHQYSMQPAVRSGRWHYYAAHGQGLYRADITAAQPTLVPVRDEPIRMLLEADTRVYMCQTAPGTRVYQTLFSLDGETAALTGRMALPRQVRVIRAASQNQALLLYKEGGGMALVDIGEQQIIWQCGQDSGWYVLDAAETPYGFFASVEREKERFCVHLDRADGHVIDTLPLSYIQQVYWVGDHLVATGTSSNYVLRWTTAPQPELMHPMT